MHLDHRLDVDRVALAEVVEDLVVDRVELAAELLDLLVAEARERALDRLGAHVLLLVCVQSSISTGPSGGVDADPHGLALLAVDLTAAHVAQLPRAELADAGVADPHPAAEVELEPGLLAGDRGSAGSVGLAPRRRSLRT